MKEQNEEIYQLGGPAYWIHSLLFSIGAILFIKLDFFSIVCGDCNDPELQWFVLSYLSFLVYILLAIFNQPVWPALIPFSSYLLSFVFAYLFLSPKSENFQELASTWLFVAVFTSFVCNFTCCDFSTRDTCDRQ